MRTEEAKLKAKYPGLGQKPGGSDFLMKRMQKGVSTISTTEKKHVFKGINSYSFFEVLIIILSSSFYYLKQFQCIFCLQQKYFDSGDYNMAKAKMKNKQLPAAAGPDKNIVTGDHIPTPQDLPQRKSSLVTSKLAG